MKIICSNCATENEKTSKYCSVCGYKISSSEIETKSEEKITELKGKTKRKLDIKTILGFVLGFFVMFYFSQYFFNPSIDIDKELAKVSSEINKNCPLIIDQYLTLDNTTTYPNKTLQYNYSIVEYEKSEINLDTVKKYVFGGVLENIKNNPDMKTLKDNKVTFNYYYKDKNGKFVTKYIVTPEMYEEK